MTKYQIEIARTISVMVDVEAESPEAAIKIVDKRDYPLPERDAWEGHKDWQYSVYDKDGELVHD